MRAHPRHGFLAVGIAVVSTVGALLLHVSLAPRFAHAPFLLFALAAALSAVLAGIGVLAFLRRSSEPGEQGARRVSAEPPKGGLAELGTIYATAPIGLCVLDREMRWVHMNERLAQINGLPAAAHIGRTVRELMPSLADQTEPVLERIFATGKPEPPLEVWETNPASGRGRRAFRISHLPLRDAAGAVIGINVAVEEMTEEKRTEETLREVASRLAGFVETAVDGIITIDERGSIESMNPAASRLFMYTPEEVAGRNVAMLMPEPYRSEHDGYLARYLRTGERKVIGIGREVHGRRKDGSEFPLELAVSETRSAGRRLFIGILRDITDRKGAEAALRDADRRKDEFLAMLAHELRNPLAPIKTAVHLLGQTHVADGPKLARIREVLDRQVAHLGHLVDDLLDISRVSRGRITLVKVPLDLSTVLTQAIETSRPLIDARRQELVVEEPAEKLRVEGDLARLTQVISNLLNNAAKYTGAGGRIQLRLEKATHGARDEAVIRVADTGRGIDPAELPHLFDLFYQAHRTIDRSEGGLGLGLSLAHDLVLMHGGRIEARSEGLGQGSEFIVHVPLLAEVPGSMRLPIPSAAASEKRRRVLVVDDNIDAAETMAMLLDQLGHDVSVAHDGEAALEAAATNPPEVVLLDIGLPRMDGYEVCTRLRHEGSNRALIAAVTGYGQPEDRRKAQEAGFDAHLLKPVSLDALKALLRAA
jgi:PAS domain S-box-containing protein